MRNSLWGMLVLLSFALGNAACSEEAGEQVSQTDVNCPSSCKAGCDKSGNCLDKVEVDVPDDDCRNEDSCETPIVTCPETCSNGCNSDGTCRDEMTCPETCSNGCNSDGTCLDKLTCPETCSNGCNSDGTCLDKLTCPEACPDTCDSRGYCPCPDTCETNICDKEGVCQCPSQCAGKCNENGVCPVMCGSEVLKKIYFANAELDILVPGSKKRTSTTTQVYVETDEKTYKLSEAPCKNDIVIESTKPSVMAVVIDSNGAAKFSSVGVGQAEAKAIHTGSDISGSIKINVLNLSRLTGSIVHQNTTDEGKVYSHWYRGPVGLSDNYDVGDTTDKIANQGDQTTAHGFDFYDGTSLYFSKAPAAKTAFQTTKGNYRYNRTKLIIYRTERENKDDIAVTVKDKMILDMAGHGQNLTIEHSDGKDYVWISNYGSVPDKSDKLDYTDGYKNSQTISRIAFKPGTKAVEAGSDQYENYYYSDKNDSSNYYYNLEPMLDLKNNKFGFRATSNKDKDNGKVYFQVFNYESVRALPIEEKDLKRNITLFENGVIKTGQKLKANVRDVGVLTPQFQFALESENNAHTAESTPYPLQGIEFANGLIYMVGGDAQAEPVSEKNNKYSRGSKIYVKVYTSSGDHIDTYYLKTNKELSNQSIYSPELNVIIDDVVSGYKNIGYFEPEGIHVKNGRAYIEVSVKVCKSRTSESDCRYRHYVWQYNLVV